jgi:hypothetical protein
MPAAVLTPQLSNQDVLDRGATLFDRLVWQRLYRLAEHSLRLG